MVPPFSKYTGISLLNCVDISSSKEDVMAEHSVELGAGYGGFFFFFQSVSAAKK